MTKPFLPRDLEYTTQAAIFSFRHACARKGLGLLITQRRSGVTLRPVKYCYDFFMWQTMLAKFTSDRPKIETFSALCHALPYFRQASWHGREAARNTPEISPIWWADTIAEIIGIYPSLDYQSTPHNIHLREYERCA